jgi:hypothetical protein
MNYIPYTYLIGWSSLNKWYYGVEYSLKTKIANPSNLWTKYFTSSNIVKNFRNVYGEPDIIQVRKTFSKGTDLEKMESAIRWEKKVLSSINLIDSKWLNGRIGGNICPSLMEKVVMERYGVKNVFSSDEIKEKIKNTNIKKYGVEHPSYSKELLEKKRQNNIKKYGVICNLQFPNTLKKVKETLKMPEVIAKRKQTIVDIYGVEFISQSNIVKEKVRNIHKAQASRDIVKYIKEYQRVFKCKLHSGWYQLSDYKLKEILNNLQNTYGIYEYEEISKIIIEKKYSKSIKKLQERSIVKEIKKYKEKYPRKIKIGRSWDRKSDESLNLILKELISKYGEI